MASLNDLAQIYQYILNLFKLVTFVLDMERQGLIRGQFQLNTVKDNTHPNKSEEDHQP